MSSEYTITGRNGSFLIDTTAVKRVTKWDCNPTLAAVNEWGDSDSAGYTNRSAGRYDCTFTVEGKFDTASQASYIWSQIYSGKTIEEVRLRISDVNINGHALSFFFPRALVTDYSMEVDIDTEAVVGWNIECGSDGLFDWPTGGLQPVV